MVRLDLKRSILGSQYDISVPWTFQTASRLYPFLIVKLDLKHSYPIVNNAGTFLPLYILFALSLLGRNTNF